MSTYQNVNVKLDSPHPSTQNMNQLNEPANQAQHNPNLTHETIQPGSTNQSMLTAIHPTQPNPTWLNQPTAPKLSFPQTQTKPPVQYKPNLGNRVGLSIPTH